MSNQLFLLKLIKLFKFLMVKLSERLPALIHAKKSDKPYITPFVAWY